MNSLLHSLTSRVGCPRPRVYDRGTPFVTEIGVGKAIKGWDEGRAYYIPEASLPPLLIITDMIRCLTVNGGVQSNIEGIA